MENLVYIRERIENKELLTELERATGGLHCTLLYTPEEKFVISMQRTHFEGKREEENIHESLQLGVVANKLASNEHYNFGIVYGADHGALLCEPKEENLCKSTNPRSLVSDCFQFALSLAIANQHHQGFCIDVNHISRKPFLKKLCLKYQSVSGNVYYVEADSALRYHRYYQGCALQCLRDYCERFGFQEARVFLAENPNASLNDFVNYLFVIDLKCKMCIAEKSPSCQLVHRSIDFQCKLADNLGGDLYTHYLHHIATRNYKISSELDYMSSLRKFETETAEVSNDLEEMVVNIRPVELTVRNYNDSVHSFGQFFHNYTMMEKAFQKLQLSHRVCNWLMKLTISSAFEKKVRTLRCKLTEDLNHFSPHITAVKHCISSSMPLVKDKSLHTLIERNHTQVAKGKKEKMVEETGVVIRNVRLHK